MNCQSFWEMHLCYYYFWQKKKFLCSTILNHHLFSSLFDVLEGTAGFQLVLHKILLLESTLKCDCKIEILLLKVLNASSIQATQQLLPLGQKLSIVQQTSSVEIKDDQNSKAVLIKAQFQLQFQLCKQKEYVNVIILHIMI